MVTAVKKKGAELWDKTKTKARAVWDKMKKTGASARSGVSKMGPIPKVGDPGKISREDVFTSAGGVKPVKDMSPEQRENYVAKDKERKSTMQTRIKGRDNTYVKNLESSKSPIGIKSKLAGAAQSAGGFLKKGAVSASGMASKAMSRVGYGIDKINEREEVKIQKEEDGKDQQQSTNNINSSSSSTTSNTTVNKFDTDAVSKWRANFIEKQHNPGNYSR